MLGVTADKDGHLTCPAGSWSSVSYETEENPKMIQQGYGEGHLGLNLIKIPLVIFMIS